MTLERFQKQVEEAKANGAWDAYMTHGILEGYDAWKDPAEFGRVVAWAGAQTNEVWIDTFAAVAAYERERDATWLETATEGGTTVIRPHVVGLDPKLFREPLTLVVPRSLAKGGRPKVLQDGSPLSVREASAGYLVDIAPAAREIRILDACP